MEDKLTAEEIENWKREKVIEILQPLDGFPLNVVTEILDWAKSHARNISVIRIISSEEVPQVV